MSVRSFAVVVAACSTTLIVGCDKGDGGAAAAASASAATAVATTAPSTAPSAMGAMNGGAMDHHPEHGDLAGGDGGAAAGMMRGPGGDHGGPGDHGERHERPH